MIPALVPALIHQALSARHSPTSAAAPAQQTATAAAPQIGGGSIAKDLGNLTTDALSLLGFDSQQQATPSAAQAAQAYGSAKSLLH
jgi:hypothetical protein